jgi:hypothetical protein
VLTGTRAASGAAAVKKVRLYKRTAITALIAIAPASMNATTT